MRLAALAGYWLAAVTWILVLADIAVSLVSDYPSKVAEFLAGGATWPQMFAALAWVAFLFLLICIGERDQ